MGMMYELYDEANTGRLDQTAFNRAAHQHPLLVQAFQLEQLDLPDDSAASSSGAAGVSMPTRMANISAMGPAVP